MKKTLSFLTGLYFIITLSIFSSCNEEDDVIQIFTGKTWKMSRLTTDKKNPPQFLPDLWKSPAEKSKSIELLETGDNFTVTFTGSDVNGEINGSSVIIRGVRSTAKGTWKANGKENTLTLEVKPNGSESDPLAKEFMKGMQAVFKYEGDVNQLTLYYQHDKITRKIGFTPQIKK